mmetsp:Transcript_78203/g.123130  ORF Transcript_78203/g.123130 Transcript_78203/m.123130 type:complete len:442 (-) Transcript_78203:366-1691(-)
MDVISAFSLFCLALALMGHLLQCILGKRSKSGGSLVIATSCLCSFSIICPLPQLVTLGIAGVAAASLPAALALPAWQNPLPKTNTDSCDITMSATALLWKLLCAMLKRRELGQVMICLLWGMHCFVTHVLLELEDLLLDLWPQTWRGEDVVVILGHPRSASTHVHHMLSQTLPESASLTFYDVLFPSLIQWYCMYPFRPLANKFLSLLDSPQHRIAIDEVAEEQQWLLLKFKDVLLPMLFPAMVDDPELFRASCDYTEADMMFIKGCMRRLLIRKPESKLYIARMLTFSPWPQYITAAFPDAKFIACLRDTEDCLRSFVSLAAVHSGGNPHTPLCKKWAQNCADTLTKGTVQGLKQLVNGAVTDGTVMPVTFRGWKRDTRSCLSSLLKELGMQDQLKSEGEVKVERREKHQSNPDLTDCLAGVTIAKSAIDDMDSMMEKFS